MFPQKHKLKLFSAPYARIHYLLVLCAFLLFSVLAFFSLLSSTNSGTAVAATSSTLNFQGRLYSSNGAIVPDGYYNIEFKLYDASTSSGSSQGSCAGDANCVWTETYYDSNGVTAGNDNRLRVVNGYFNANLGSLTAFGAIDWDQEHWLTLNIGGPTQTATPTWDDEMTPRVKLTAVPYAFRAGALMDGSGNAYDADDLAQLAPGSVQGVNSANTAIRVNQTGAGGILQLQSANTDRFVIENDGDVVSSADGTFQGGDLTVGTASVAGDLTLYDGSSNTGTLAVAALGQNSVFTLPDPGDGSDTICLQELANCAGSGDIVQDGNSFSEAVVIGTNDNYGIELETNGVTRFSLSNTGAALFQNGTNSTTAFQIQNAASASLFTVDTTNAGAISLLGNNSGEISAWTTDGDSLPANRFAGGTVVANGYIYVIGGGDGSLIQDEVYYAKLNANGSVDAWSTTTALPAGRSDFQAAFYKGYIYIVGGYTTTTVDTVLYAKVNNDGTLGSWTTSSNLLPDERQDSATVAYNGYLYTTHGQDSIASPQDEVFYAKINSDGSIGAWSTSVNAHNTSRIGSIGATANGYFYTLGGNNGGGGPQTTTSKAKINADGTVGTWSNTTAMPAAREFSGATVSNGHIYVVAGRSTSSNGSQEEEVFYAPLNADGTVGAYSTSANSVTTGTHAPYVTSANGYIYAIGGRSTAAVTPNVYYASTARVTVGGNLDLVGLSGENLAEGGSGGSLTAGDGIFVGTLNVQGQSNFWDDIYIEGNLTNAGNATFINSTNSTTAFQIQNAAGTSNLFVADTTNTRIGIGTNAPTAVLQVSSAGGGTDLFKVTDTTATARDVMTIADGGATTFRNQTDSTAAFQIQNAAGTSNLFVADTTNTRIGIGTATPGYTLDVAGDVSTQAIRDAMGWVQNQGDVERLKNGVNNGGFGGGASVNNQSMDSNSFSFFDTNSVNANSEGFAGSVFDGRYVYFIPYSKVGGPGPHGMITRYDTTKDFSSASSYTVYDTTAVNANSEGFIGGVFDGRYLYLVPYNHGSISGQITRYDTTASFTSAGSYSVYDTTAVNANSRGFIGANFDGRYIYFIPYYNGSTYSGQITRYDTTASFTSAGSYSVYDTTAVSAGSAGFYGSVFDGRYLYLVPNTTNGSSYHGQITRYDTTASFTSAGSYSVFDSTTVNTNSRGFYTAVYDGRYIYYVPYANAGGANGQITRYDTRGSFTSTSSYSVYDTNNVSANSEGFNGAYFDGKYIYFIPHHNGSAHHGNLLRYDTSMTFNSSSAYQLYNMAGLNAASIGFIGGSGDGRYLYLSPYSLNGSVPNGQITRIATYSGGSDTINSINRLATSSEFLMNSNGSISLQNNTNSTGAFTIQNADASRTLFSVDTTNNRVGIGTATPGAPLEISNGTDGTRFGLLTNGGINIHTSNSAADITINPGGDLELGTSLTDSVTIGRTDQNITTTINGSVLVKSQTNSATAFQIQNAAGTTTLLNADTTNLDLTIDGDTIITGSLALEAGANFSTTGTSNNINFGSVSLVRLTGASTQTLTGIDNGTDGEILTIINAAAQDAIIGNEEGTSDAENRITTGTGEDVDLVPDAAITLIYDSTSQRWRITGSAPIVGGATATLQTAYDNGSSGDQVMELSSTNDSFIIRNPSSSGTDSAYTVIIDQLSTGATGGLSIQSAGTGNLLLITDTTATARDVLTIADGGATTFRNQTNSATAFDVQGTSGYSAFNINTSDGYTFNNGIYSASDNLLQNYSFEAGSGAVNEYGANFWGSYSGGTASILNNNTHARSGNKSFTFTSNSTYQDFAQTNIIAVQPGDNVYFEGFVKTSAGANGNLDWGVYFKDKDKVDTTGISDNITAAEATTSYTRVRFSGTVPAGSYYMYVYAGLNAAATSGTWYFDDFHLQKTNTIAPVQFRNSVDSTTAFQIQNAAGTSNLLIADTSNNRIGIGVAPTERFEIRSLGTSTNPFLVTASDGSDLVKVRETSGGVGQFQVADASGTSRTFINGDASISFDATQDTVISRSAAGTLQVKGLDGTSATTLLVKGTTSQSTTNLFEVQPTGSTTNLFSVGATGSLVSRNSTDSTTAFQIVNAGGTNNVLTANTTDGRIGINTSATSYDLSFGGDSARTIGLQTRSSNAAGSNLTISAGAAGAGGSAFTGGTLTLQGGAAGGTGNANGGTVAIAGGAGTGTGVQGLVNLSTTAFTSASTQTFGVSGSLTAGLVDQYSTIPVNATAPDVTVTIPVPHSGNQTVGRLLYISAVDNSNDFTISLGGTSIEIVMKENSTATLIWNGTGWTAAGASSSTDLQSAYNNTISSAGGAELVLNPSGGAADGLTVRNNGTTPIVGGLLEVQTSIGSNLFSVNNNSTEYANNGGAENSTFTMWTAAPGGGAVSRYTTAGDNIATGQASVFVNSSAAAGTGAANALTTSLTANLKYTVSYAVRHTSSSATFNTLDTVYSRDGTNTSTTACATGSTATNGIWTRITCSFTAPSSGITSGNAIFIRHSDAVEHDFYIDNLSVSVSADVNHAADGSVDSALGTNWTNFGTLDALTRETTVIYDTGGSVAVDTPNAADRGVRNNLTITPAVSTQYLVTFYARSSNSFSDIRVRYTRDGGTNFVNCVDYNTQTLTTSAFTQITCLFTTDSTTATDPDVIIDQPTGSDRIFYIDALSVTLNTNNANNVQIGGGNKGGPVTLFTLDRSAGAPIAANNDAYLGSMYFDTTTGRIQCYEAGGWGTCGAPPDNIVNLNPEYAGAVLNGTGVGTMTADLCSDDSALSVNATLCDTGEAKNYYRWTSPQATQQTYSIYVSYQLPETFNGFASDDTVQLVARADSTTNAAVTYEMFKSTGSAVTKCGTSETTVVTSADTWQSVGINGNEATGCGFTSSSAGDYLIFKINLKANSNANAYVSTLSFTTTGR